MVLSNCVHGLLLLLLQCTLVIHSWKITETGDAKRDQASFFTAARAKLPVVPLGRKQDQIVDRQSHHLVHCCKQCLWWDQGMPISHFCWSSRLRMFYCQELQCHCWKPHWKNQTMFPSVLCHLAWLFNDVFFPRFLVSFLVWLLFFSCPLKWHKMFLGNREGVGFLLKIVLFAVFAFDCFLNWFFTWSQQPLWTFKRLCTRMKLQNASWPKWLKKLMNKNLVWATCLHFLFFSTIRPWKSESTSFFNHNNSSEPLTTNSSKLVFVVVVTISSNWLEVLSHPVPSFRGIGLKKVQKFSKSSKPNLVFNMIWPSFDQHVQLWMIVLLHEDKGTTNHSIACQKEMIMKRSLRSNQVVHTICHTQSHAFKFHFNCWDTLFVHLCQHGHTAGKCLNFGKCQFILQLEWSSGHRLKSNKGKSNHAQAKHSAINLERFNSQSTKGLHVKFF